ncbi:MAG: ABC transporter ATP-binding protein [Candidatus Rokubacteria bacterium]|nr:ABC transporter ATP-binding protein [Candidatus Rokubacteria bacterium]
MATVELAGVSKTFGSHRAVSGLTLGVESGECLALLGPSGCGKTTTLNMIAGFIDPDAGEVRIAGRRMQGVPPYRRDTGMVFQHYALFPHLTVFENLAFGLTMRKTPRADVGARVRQALDLVRLEGLERRYPRELSGGQQQRVALARALVIRPAVLLLDEPLSNLDAKLRQEMRLEIAEIQQRLRITTVFVTHDQEEALVIADRIAVMRDGVVEQVDAPATIYARPRTPFVARFIGDANFLPGRVAGQDARGVTVDTDAGPAVVAATETPRPPGARVVVMVRPEKIRLGRAPSAGDNCLAGELRAIAFTGAVTSYRLTMGATTLTAALHDVAHLAGVAPGDKVYAEWRAADGLALDDADARP